MRRKETETDKAQLPCSQILRTLTTSVPGGRFLHHYSSVKKVSRKVQKSQEHSYLMLISPHHSPSQGASFSLFSPGNDIQLSYGQAIPTSPTTESSSKSSCTPACRGSSGSFQALASSSCCSSSYCHCTTSPALLSCPKSQVLFKRIFFFHAPPQVFCPKQGLCVPESACSPSCCPAER